MKCSELERHLPDHILEELPPELQIQINEHLATCAKCRAESARIETTVSAFKNSVIISPSPEIFARVREQVPLKKVGGARLFGVPKSLVYAFGAFLVGVIITRSVDEIFVTGNKQPVQIEVREEKLREVPYSDTVEFYAAPARNLARI
ncbi:MAG: zf-HC2 domain-containing protein [candidate division WOR-3 bacterium]|nr:MAG: zf-HC2 domain-containing protein [candidate division WOR-3 bacterium]